MKLSLVASLFLALASSAHAGDLAADVATLVGPASKLCLATKAASLAGEVLTSQGVEKALDFVSCYPKDSSQARGYSRLAHMLYSPNYGEYISSLRGNNAGLIAYFAKRLKSDRKFAAQARNFYDELRAQDKDFFEVRNFRPDRRAPRLTDESGKGEYAEFQPGWLWAIALKHSENNPVAAIEMIGLCGHDDIQDWSMVSGDNDFKIKCPNVTGSAFYLAKSLGYDIDISSEMKMKIASIQAPKMGMSVLPSKAYHYYGSALFACAMKSEGLSNAEIFAATSMVSRLYRGIDMRNRILFGSRHATVDRGALEKSLRTDCESGRGEFICPTLDTSERINRWVDGKMTEFDSYFLIERWAMLKKIPVLGMPVNLDLSITAVHLKDVPKGWSRERFAAAVNRIRTYATDIEWTADQHRIGTEFALKHCSLK